MKKLMFAVILGMFLISLASVSAEEIYQIDTSIDLKQPCYNNGTFCSSTAACNITVVDPDSTILVSNGLMQNRVSYHNYTLNTTFTDNLGEHRYFVSCCDGGACASDTFEFEITQTGAARLNEGESNVLLMSILTIFAISLFFFVLGMKMNSPLASLAAVIFSGVMLFISVLASVEYVTENLSNLGGVVGTYSSFFLVIKSVVSVGITFLVLWALWTVYKAWGLKTGRRRDD